MTETPIVVRLCDDDDLAALAAAYREPPGTPHNRHLRRLVEQREGRLQCLAAWDGEAPVGWCLLRRPDADPGADLVHARTAGCAELEDLFVAEHARRRGAATLLVAAVEQLARDQGERALGLEVTLANPDNEAARRLYDRLGYQDAGLGEFVSGYSYWDADGVEHRDEELHRYLVKRL